MLVNDWENYTPPHKSVLSANRMSKMTGMAHVNVRVEHIQQALKTIRSYTQANWPEHNGGPMDELSFDDILMAATLLATFEALESRHFFLTAFLEGLVREGGGRWLEPAVTTSSAKSTKGKAQ